MNMIVARSRTIETLYFFSMISLRIPTAVQPMTGIEGFKYQASDG